MNFNWKEANKALGIAFFGILLIVVGLGAVLGWAYVMELLAKEIGLSASMIICCAGAGLVLGSGVNAVEQQESGKPFRWNSVLGKGLVGSGKGAAIGLTAAFFLVYPIWTVAVVVTSLLLFFYVAVGIGE